MIKVKFFERQNKFVGFESSGHSGYAEEGSDIVCSAVSALLLNAEMGLREVLKLKLKTSQKDGYSRLELLSEPTEASELLLETTFRSLKNISKGYKGFVKVELKGEQL